MHSNITPNIYSWIGIGAGRSGLGYNYVITYKYGAIELYIYREKESKEENKRIFDELHPYKKEIEEVFVEELEWQRLDDRRASRVRKVYTYARFDDKNKWDKLQDDMIDGMIKLEKALEKYINRLEL